MKNLETLSAQEAQSINGGCQIGNCWPNPFPKPTTGPTFPEDLDIPPLGDPTDWDTNFPVNY